LTSADAGPEIPFLHVDTSACPTGWDETEGVFEDRIVVGSHGMWSVGLDRYAGFEAYLELVNARGGVDGRQLSFEPLFLAPNDLGMYLRTFGWLMVHVQPFVVWTVGPTNSGRELQRLVETSCVPDIGAIDSVDLPASDMSRWTMPDISSSTLEAALWVEAVKALAGSGANVVVVRDEHPWVTSHVTVFLRRLAAAAPQATVDVMTHTPGHHIQLSSGVDVVVAALSSGCVGLAGLVRPTPTVVLASCTPRWLEPTPPVAGTELWRVNLAGPTTGPMDDAAGHEVPPSQELAWGVPVEFRLGWADAAVLVEVLERAADRPGGLTRSNVIGVARSFETDHPLIEGATLDGSSRVTTSSAGLLERWDPEAGAWVEGVVLHSGVDREDVVDGLAGRAAGCPPHPVGLTVSTSGWTADGTALSRSARPRFVVDGMPWTATTGRDRFGVQVRSADGHFHPARGEGSADADCPGRFWFDVPSPLVEAVAARPGPHEITLRLWAGDTLDTRVVSWPDDFREVQSSGEITLRWDLGEFAG